MPKERPNKRKERREVTRQNYLAGKARRPYSHTPVLDSSIQEDQDNGAASSSSAAQGVFQMSARFE